MNLLKKIFIINLAIILLIISAGCDGRDKTPEKSDADMAGAGNPDEIKDPETAESFEPETDSEANNGDGKREDGFAFIYKGASVCMGDYIKNVLEQIGPQSDYYESPSCTSDGIMQTYCYGGLEIYTYAKNEGDEYRVFSLTLIDDSNATAEGIYIGKTVGDMKAAYGSEFEEEQPGYYYRYVKNGTRLSFDVDGDIIICITYELLNI